MQEKKITLKIHKKSRFQPNEKMFAESCSVRYKHLLRAKKIFGVIGTLRATLYRDRVRLKKMWHKVGKMEPLIFRPEITDGMLRIVI